MERLIKEKEDAIIRTSKNTYHELMGEKKDKINDLEGKIDQLLARQRQIENDLESKEKQKVQFTDDVKYKKNMLDDIEKQFSEKVQKFHDYEREMAKKQTQIAQRTIFFSVATVPKTKGCQPLAPCF